MILLAGRGPSEPPPSSEPTPAPEAAETSLEADVPPAPVGQIDLGPLSDEGVEARQVTAFVPPGPGPWPVLFVLDGHAESTLRVRHATLRGVRSGG